MPEFEIEILSNPLLALNANRPIWDFDDYNLYAQYDIDLIKPALLFGDHINLATFREIMREMTYNRGSTLWRMPMQRVMAFLRLAVAHDSREIKILGLNVKELPTTAEAKAEAEAVIEDRDPYSERFRKFWDDYEEQIELFADNAYEIWKQR
jgi:hypothetical protein